MGAGVNAAMLQAALHDSGIRGKALMAPICAFVGLSGWLLGGGFGLLGRYNGLACDSLTHVKLVLADGRLVTATRDGEHRDLFWASCGGGGGTFGVATEFGLRLTPLPGGKSEVTKIDVSWR